jgi:hypothetical protein
MKNIFLSLVVFGSFNAFSSSDLLNVMCEVGKKESLSGKVRVKGTCFVDAEERSNSKNVSYRENRPYYCRIEMKNNFRNQVDSITFKYKMFQNNQSGEQSFEEDYLVIEKRLWKKNDDGELEMDYSGVGGHYPFAGEQLTHYFDMSKNRGFVEVSPESKWYYRCRVI